MGSAGRKNVECKNGCFLCGLHIHVCVGVLKREKFLLLSLVQSNFTCCPCSLLKRFIMTSKLPRRSRRLQNLAPEEDSLGVCFICQDEFRIEQLSRLQKTDCCRVLLHRHCLAEMVARTSICGNCRRDRTPGNTRTLPMIEDSDLEEMQAGNYFFSPGTYLIGEVSRELNEYRQFGLPNPHRQDSQLWPLLPFDIADDILFEYLALIDDFIHEESGEIMFIHGFIVLPVPATVEVRHAFYDYFLMNIPEQVLDFVNGIRFRFLFYHDERQPSFNVTTRYVLSYGEPAWYPTDIYYV